MPNILLTEKCVRSCPYCFAKTHMENCEFDDLLTWDNLIYLADFIETSGDRHISLLGGEPTLHPSFCEFLAYLLERGFHVTVFTSGILSPSKLAELEEITQDLAPERLSFVCNINEPSVTPANEARRQEEFLKRFGKFSVPGFNVWRPEIDMTFLFDLIERYDLHRNVRIGLAHPIPGEANVYVHLEDLKATVDRFISFMPLFEKHKVTPGVDCGLPLCMFDETQLGQLFKAARGQVKFNCGPAIDIGTDMSVWSCFPLHNFDKKSVYDFNSIREIGDYYMGKHKTLRGETRAGIFEDCRTCSHFDSGLCAGGCLAHLLAARSPDEAVIGVANA